MRDEFKRAAPQVVIDMYLRFEREAVEVITMPEGQLPQYLRSPTGYEHDLSVDNGRIRKELGYAERVSRVQALLNTIAWEQKNPPAEVDAGQFDYAAEDAAVRDCRKR